MAGRPARKHCSLGQVVGTGRRLGLPPEVRDKHLYVVGATGSGKSKFLEHLLRQDILNWRRDRAGLLLIDPHGSLYDELMAWMARYQLDRPVVPIDLRRSDWIAGYNPLRQREAEPAVVVDNLVEAMAYVWGESGTNETPRPAKWARTILSTLYEHGYTLAEALHLTAKTDLMQMLAADLSDPVLKRNWLTAQTLKPNELEAEMASTINRLQRFLGNRYLRTIFGQSEATLDMRRALDEGWIVLVSLAREGARIGKEDADLFATLLLADLWTGAQERGKRQGMKPFRVYLDEFERFTTPTLAENLDEARGFGLQMVMSHQFPHQLRCRGEQGERLYHSVMENARSKVVFQLSSDESLEPLAKWLFRGVMDPHKIKHELYSTKVMDYRMQYAASYGTSRTEGATRATNVSHSAGKSVSGDADGETGWTEYESEVTGEGVHETSSETESVTRSPMLVPQMGRELSHVQFASLDEQLFRAMAALFDQEQRQCAVRLLGMKAPVSVFTPTVEPARISAKRVERYIQRCVDRWPFLVSYGDGVCQLEARQEQIRQKMFGPAEVDEPASFRRRIS